MFMSCFVHERKHKMLKRYLNDIRNTIVFEKSVLSEATCHHIQAMIAKSFNFETGLLKPRKASRATAAFILELLELPAGTPVMTSSTARHRPLATSSVGDVVLYNDPDGYMTAGQVWTHLSVDGVPVTVFQKLKLVSQDRAAMIAIFRVTDDHAALPTEDIVDAVIWDQFGVDPIRVLFPPEWA